MFPNQNIPYPYGQINPSINSFNQNQIVNNNIINNQQQQQQQQTQQNKENNINKRPNKNLLLNRIKERIIIDSHSHPLLCCFTVEREVYSEIWTCKNCGNNYSFDIPSFYCTYCDYDFCQNCLMRLPLGKIKMANDNSNYEVYINKNHPNYKPYLHRHPLALIRIEDYFYDDEKVIHCKNANCGKNIKLNKDCFYYCSLCDKYICKDCFKNSNSNFVQKQSFDGISSFQNINRNFNHNFSNNFSNNNNNFNNSNNDINNFIYNNNISNNNNNINTNNNINNNNINVNNNINNNIINNNNIQEIHTAKYNQNIIDNNQYEKIDNKEQNQNQPNNEDDKIIVDNRYLNNNNNDDKKIVDNRYLNNNNDDKK